MYVRLAFAVAAHLEAEILVVDEVLSVGDAEFQSKCINRMSEVAGSGRTVLFVSHNFAAVRALTKRSIVLEGGKLAFDGPVEAGLTYYTSTLGRAGTDRNWGRGKDATLVSAKLLDENGNATDHFTPGTALRLQVVVDTTGMPGMSLTVDPARPAQSAGRLLFVGSLQQRRAADRRRAATNARSRSTGCSSPRASTTSTCRPPARRSSPTTRSMVRCSSTSPAAIRAMSVTTSGRIRASAISRCG